MITGIGHLALRVSDMDASLHFFCEQLGFRKAFETANERGEPWIVYLQIRGGQFIELFYGDAKEQPDPAPTDEGAPGYLHLCLEVKDLIATVEELRRRGVEIDREPRQGRSGSWQAWITAPDGFRIELMEYSAGSQQAQAAMLDVLD